MANTLSVTINGKEYVSTEAKKAESSLTTLQAVGDGVNHAIEISAKAAAAAFAGITTAIGAVSAAAVNIAGVADNIDKMSQKIGLSREAFQEWDFILSQNGMNIEQLQTSMKTLASAASDAADGSKTYSTTFDELGISVHDASGALKDQETLFNETILALTEMDNVTRRTSLASDLFGRSATELAPLLNSGAGAIEGLKAKAHDLGLILSDETINAGVNLTDTIDQLKRSFTAISAEALTPLLPLLNNLGQSFIGLFRGTDGSGEAFTNSISEVLNQAMDMIVNLAPTLVQMAGQLIANLATGLTQNTDSLSEAVTGIISAIGDFLANNTAAILIAAIKLVVALGKGIVTAIPNIAASIQDLIKDIADRLARSAVEMVQAGKDMIEGLIQGIRDFASRPVEAVKDVGRKVVDGFKDFFGIRSPSKVFAGFGKYFMEGLALGIQENDGIVAKALVDAGLTPNMGGEISITATGEASGSPASTISAPNVIMDIVGQFSGGLGSIISSLSSVKALLDPIGTILSGVMDVLSPVVDSLLAPLVGILKIIGQTIGSVLAPAFQVLGPIVEFISSAFVWFYNKAILPVANGFITVFNAIRIGFANVINGIIRAINRIPFVNVGYIDVPGISDGTLSAIDSASLSRIGGGASGTSYSGANTGSNTSINSLTINIYQTFDGNVIGEGGLAAVGEYVVRAIKEFSGVGGNVKIVGGLA